MIGVGGWLPVRDQNGALQTHLSPWFALELTAAGRNLFDRIDPVATVRYQTILTELSDADRAALAELLNRLIAATEGPLEADAGPPH